MKAQTSFKTLCWVLYALTFVMCRKERDQARLCCGFKILSEAREEMTCESWDHRRRACHVNCEGSRAHTCWISHFQCQAGPKLLGISMFIFCVCPLNFTQQTERNTFHCEGCIAALTEDVKIIKILFWRLTKVASLMSKYFLRYSVFGLRNSH